MWGPRGTFSPCCVENPSPGAYTLEGSLFSSVVLADWTWRWGQLRCLRAMPFAMPLPSTVITSSPLVSWVPLGIFLRLFKGGSNSHCWGFSLSPGSFLLLFLFLIFSTVIYHLSQLQQFFFKTDLLQTPVFVMHSRYLESTE